MADKQTLEKFRDEARSWLEKNFSKSDDLRSWGKKLGTKGWGTPTWP